MAASMDLLTVVCWVSHEVSSKVDKTAAETAEKMVVLLVARMASNSAAKMVRE